MEPVRIKRALTQIFLLPTQRKLIQFPVRDGDNHGMPRIKLMPLPVSIVDILLRTMRNVPRAIQIDPKHTPMLLQMQFPRVHIFDHSSYKSLGYSVRALMTAVETEWFLYLHSDVYLPEKWFDTMRTHQS